MTDSASESCHFIFAEFLDHLRRNGFVIGVDSHLRLYQLLSRFGSDCAPGDLKTLLCPIFATSKEQQELFYNAFDSYFAIFSTPADNDDTDSSGGPTVPSYSQVG